MRDRQGAADHKGDIREASTYEQDDLCAAFDVQELVDPVATNCRILPMACFELRYRTLQSTVILQGFCRHASHSYGIRGIYRVDAPRKYSSFRVMVRFRSPFVKKSPPQQSNSDDLARMRDASGLNLRLFGISLRVASVAGRTQIGKIGLMILSAWIFLAVPDIDLALMPILHHRSIVTHSILPALVFLILGRSLGAAPIAGAMIGLSVHLACDMLSPMVGFAQIWLPQPFLIPLGPLSYLWLSFNALFGYVLALRLAMASLHPRIAVSFAVTLSGVTGAAYGALNEQSTGAVIVSVLFPLMTAGWLFLRSRTKAREHSTRP